MWISFLFLFFLKNILKINLFYIFIISYLAGFIICLSFIL